MENQPFLSPQDFFLRVSAPRIAIPDDIDELKGRIPLTGGLRTKLWRWKVGSSLKKLARQHDRYRAKAETYEEKLEGLSQTPVGTSIRSGFLQDWEALKKVFDSLCATADRLQNVADEREAKQAPGEAAVSELTQAVADIRRSLAEGKQQLDAVPSVVRRYVLQFLPAAHAQPAPRAGKSYEPPLFPQLPQADGYNPGPVASAAANEALIEIAMRLRTYEQCGGHYEEHAGHLMRQSRRLLREPRRTQYPDELTDTLRKANNALSEGIRVATDLGSKVAGYDESLQREPREAGELDSLLERLTSVQSELASARTELETIPEKLHAERERQLQAASANRMSGQRRPPRRAELPGRSTEEDDAVRNLRPRRTHSAGRSV